MARNRCGYCLSQQKYLPSLLEIEHLIPKARGGGDNEENLWLSCRLCNNYKGTQINHPDPLTKDIVPLFNPRNQHWKRHFYWEENGTFIVGRTRQGRATVAALKLNDPIAVQARRNWVAVGWHPPI